VTAEPPAPPRWGSITDVPGIRVGQARRAGAGWLTGVTVVLPPPGAVGSVEVRGGGPATHETDALAPATLVPTVDAVTLTGGSAYGLATAGGVARWCEADGRGFPVGPPDDPGAIIVPIVPAAAVFDLGRGGDPAARPDADLGYEAAAAATGDVPERGVAGAGTGGLVAAGLLKGGVGTACVDLGDGLLVGAIAVVNAAGTPVDAVTGGLLGTPFVPPGLWRPVPPAAAERDALLAALAKGAPPPWRVRPRGNTTLAVVATNARLDPSAAHRTASAAHDGLARATTPAHTLVDGDVVFSLATGEVPVEGFGLVALQAAAADAVLLAVLDGVLAARSTPTAAGTVPGYADLCPSAVAGP
jgi:L-aminopeptidase/D-esterase-like protein